MNCVECGEPIKRGKKAISGCCGNTCRKIRTARIREEDKVLRDKSRSASKKVSGRICRKCKEKIVGPNMFFCNSCHPHIREPWI